MQHAVAPGSTARSKGAAPAASSIQAARLSSLSPCVVRPVPLRLPEPGLAVNINGLARFPRHSAGPTLVTRDDQFPRWCTSRGAIDEIGNDGCPAGLVTRANAGAVVAVEVFV